MFRRTLPPQLFQLRWIGGTCLGVAVLLPLHPAFSAKPKVRADILRRLDRVLLSVPDVHDSPALDCHVADEELPEVEVRRRQRNRHKQTLSTARPVIPSQEMNFARF